MIDNLYEVLKLAGNFNQFLQLVDIAGYADALKSMDEFTVFAIGDDAFTRVPSDFLDAIYKDRVKIAELFDYHIIPGKYPIRQITNMPTLQTRNEEIIKVNLPDGDIYIENAKIIRPDMEATNGIIHEIDNFILIGAK